MLTVGDLRKTIDGLDDDTPVFVALAKDEESWTNLCNCHSSFAGVEGWDGFDAGNANVCISTQESAILTNKLLGKLREMLPKKSQYIPSTMEEMHRRDLLEKIIKMIENDF